MAATSFDTGRGTGHLPVETLEALAEVGRGRRTITPDDPLAEFLQGGWLDAPGDLRDPASVRVAGLAAVLARPELRIGIERRVAGAVARCSIAWSRQATLATGAPDQDGLVGVAVSAPDALADVVLGAARLGGRPAAPSARCSPQSLADAVERRLGVPIAGTPADQLVLVRVVVTTPFLDAAVGTTTGGDAVTGPDDRHDPSDQSADATVPYDMLDGDAGLWRIEGADDGSGELVLAPWSGADEHARWTMIHDRLAAGTTSD